MVFLGSNFDQVITRGRGEGGGGNLTKILYREAPPWGPTPDPFIYHFWLKRTPFVYRLLTNVTPFTHKVWTPFNCCKCTVFKTWTNHKTRKLYGLFYIQKMHLSALLGIFANRNDRFPYPFIRCFNYHIPEAWKKTFLSGGIEPPRIGHCREYPPPRVITIIHNGGANEL